MTLKKPDLKSIVMMTTIVSSILLFFNFFTISIPLLETFLESSHFSISFFTLPDFIDKSMVGLMTNLAGKGTSALLLILCAVIKYICLLSSFFGIYGVWKFYKDNKNTKFIFASQLVNFAMCVLAFLLIMIVNVFIFRYAGFLSEAMNLEETLELNFLPTIWLFLSAASSLFSLIKLGKMQDNIEE